MSQHSRLNDPEIRAVLEANRAKIAMMQQQKQQQQEQLQPTTQASNSQYHSNPVYGDDNTSSPHIQGSLGEGYTPKLSDSMKSAPISGLSSDACLPPVGDLFSPEPQLPISLRLNPPITTNTTSTAATSSTDISSSYLLDSNSYSASFASFDSSRPYLTGKFLYDIASGMMSLQTQSSEQKERNQNQQPYGLDTYPSSEQEKLLLEDLLYAFDGMDGTWIKSKILDGRGGPRIEYRVVSRGQIEPSLLEMATRMTPLCEYVAIIQRFIEVRRSYAWGIVSQALSGAMRHVLQDWQLMIAQLEHQLRSGKLTLHALWYYVQPPMAALRLTATIAADASSRRLRGAALLSLLHARTASLLGDAAGHKLCLRLLRAAARPYFALLERWVRDGDIDDPYEEFMVVQDASISKEELSADGGCAYWSERFVLRRAIDPFTGAMLSTSTLGGGSGALAAHDHSCGRDVPSFLSQYQRIILDAGKYLNLLKSCGHAMVDTLGIGVHLGTFLFVQESQDKPFGHYMDITIYIFITCTYIKSAEYDEHGKYLLLLEEAHRTAAAAAMSLLRRELGLSHGLSALKRYFLVAQGDLFLGFMDGGEAELNRPCGVVSLTQLQAILDIAVRSTSAVDDPCAVQLHAAYDHRSVLNMLIAITQTSATHSPAIPGAATTIGRGQVGGSVSAVDSPQKAPRLAPVLPAAMTASEKATYGRQKLARESFILSYPVPWPMSLVAPDSAMAQYQMIFRHLFECKWVERELNRVCRLYLATSALANTQRRAARRESSVAIHSVGALSPAAAALTQAYRTCQLMTHFFRQYLLYVTFEVIEPLWRSLEKHIDSAMTVDEIVDFHKVFLRKVMKGLLLSRKVVVLRALLGLKDLALRFVALSSEYLTVDYDDPDKKIARASDADAAALTAAVEKARMTPIERRKAREVKIRATLDENLSHAEFSMSLDELRSKFEARCSDFMNALSEAYRQARSERSDTREELDGLLYLMGRLDYNEFFSKSGIAASLSSGGRTTTTVM